MHPSLHRYAPIHSTLRQLVFLLRRLPRRPISEDERRKRLKVGQGEECLDPTIRNALPHTAAPAVELWEDIREPPTPRSVGVAELLAERGQHGGDASVEECAGVRRRHVFPCLCEESGEVRPAHRVGGVLGERAVGHRREGRGGKEDGGEVEQLVRAVVQPVVRPVVRGRGGAVVLCLNLCADFLHERRPGFGRELALEAKTAEDAVDSGLDALRDRAPAIIQEPPRVGQEEALGVGVAGVMLRLGDKVLVQGDLGAGPGKPRADGPGVSNSWGETQRGGKAPNGTRAEKETHSGT